MGSNYSYLKIRVTDYTAGIVFQHQNFHKKVIIAAGNPSNSFIDIKWVASDEYDTYGDWYYYNGNSNTLLKVLQEYNPKKDNINFLICRLNTECNLQEYENTWHMFTKWATNVSNYISNNPVIVAAVGWITSGALLGGQKRLPIPEQRLL